MRKGSVLRAVIGAEELAHVFVALGRLEKLAAGAIATNDEHTTLQCLARFARPDADEVHARTQRQIELERGLLRVSAALVRLVINLSRADEDVEIEDAIAVGGEALE